MEAVDALVFTRDVIYNLAAKYGVRATLYPKVFAEACTFPFFGDRWVDGQVGQRRMFMFR